MFNLIISEGIFALQYFFEIEGKNTEEEMKKREEINKK